MNLKKVTAFHLKCVALVCMVLDHFAATLLLPLINGCIFSQENALLVWTLQNRDALIEVYYLLRNIGRLAFPLYCFLLVEGFQHTRSVPKYALRLALFALLSEIPFDLAFNDSLLEFSYNNVFLTLLLGLLLIWGVSHISALCRRIAEAGKPKWLAALLWAAAVGALSAVMGLLASGVFCTDYAATGVMTVLLLYLLRRWPVPAFILAVLMLTVQLVDTEIYAIFALPLIALYGGGRGRSMKYFFYAFYPAHLLLFALLSRLLA